jgi:hypothetical protein
MHDGTLMTQGKDSIYPAPPNKKLVKKRKKIYATP